MNLLQNPSAEHMRHYFNVSEPVGLNCKNRPDDVYLVQFMLYKLFTHAECPRKLGFSIKGDGICGPKTRKAILTFQQMLKPGFKKNWNWTMHADGKIHPAPSPTIADGGTIHTILALNKLYARYFPEGYEAKAPMKKVHSWLAQ